jgi:hypothetical protein
MGSDSAYLIYGLLILALGGAIGAGLQAIYQRGLSAGEKQGEKGSIKLEKDHLITLHWLATNGFHRLLLLGERGSGGFQTRERAEEAHWTLDRLENHLPKDAVVDASFNRMGDIAMHWPDGPLSPARRLLKQQRLDKEP